MVNLKYSYIEPRKKILISAEVGLILSFFAMLFIFIIGVIIYLSFKIDMFDSKKVAFNHQIEQTKYYTESIAQDINIINSSTLLSAKLQQKNLFFLKSVKNLLELVPDQITLSKLEMEKSKLTIYGVTPTKDIYNLLMLAPLRSIFDQSYTSFFIQENGWYKFVSYNSMDENLTIFRNR